MLGDARRCGSPIQAPAPGYERTLVGLLICIAAVALRLWLSWRSPASYDMKWYWAGISADLERGARLYEDTPYHFSPVWSWLLLLFGKASRWGLPFDATLRTFLRSWTSSPHGFSSVWRDGKDRRDGPGRPQSSSLPTP